MRHKTTLIRVKLTNSCKLPDWKTFIEPPDKLLHRKEVKCFVYFEHVFSFCNFCHLRAHTFKSREITSFFLKTAFLTLMQPLTWYECMPEIGLH